MKKRLTNYLVSVLTLAMIMTSLPVNLLTAKAIEGETINVEETVSDADVVTLEELIMPDYQTTGESELTGTFGDNNGFSWSYDESTATLTVSGGDSGLNGLQENVTDAVMENVRNIVFQDCVVSGSLAHLLNGLDEVESVEFHNFDTSNVTNMGWMFCDCNSLKTLDWNHFDTSNVTDMSRMFQLCLSLKNLDVSSFDTSNVTDMSYMFDNCGSLTNLDVSRFDTDNVTDMGSMFSGCLDLETLDVSGFNTGNVTDMSYMFAGCDSLETLDVNKFDTSNVMDMQGMFYYCKSVNSLDISNFNTSNVTDMSYMFYACSSLNKLELSAFDTGQVTDMSSMISGCDGLESIKAPKTMVEGQVIDLSVVLYDSDGNSVSQITSNHCNETLVKEYRLYTIKFAGNGATSGKMSNLANRKYGVSYKLTSNAYKRTGYTFTGWNTKADGKAKSYKNLATVKNLTDVNGQTVTLYAQWTPNNYTIKFNKNGATSGSMKAMTNRKYGTNYKLSNNTFKRKGYIFKGWTVKKNGTGKFYKNKASVKNLTSTNGGTVTLYAQWKKENYKITYKLNGGKNNSSNPKKYDVTTKTITLKAPTKAGYTFGGWYSDSKFKKTVKKIKKGSTGNITLYAKWDKK